MQGSIMSDSLDDTHPDPVELFLLWYKAAEMNTPLHNAMTLATASGQGLPSARMVLLKHADKNGFVFYTNYNSRKGRELQVNPRAALVFHWQAMERQVRIEGVVERTAEYES